MLRTIRAKLFTILFIFSLFTSLSFSLAYWFVQEHDNDEDVIDLLSKGVYLINKINRVSINPPESADPSQEIKQFEEMIQILENGGTYQTYDGTEVSFTKLNNIDTYVVHIRDAWNKYRRVLNDLDQSAPITEEYEAKENALLSNGNEVVFAVFELLGYLEDLSNFRHNSLLLADVLFLVISVPILGLSFYFINNRISKPLLKLTKTAKMYREGSFEQNFHISGDDEISLLANTFEEMKVDIQAHQATLEKEILDRIHEISTAFEFSQDLVSQLELSQLLSSAVEKVKLLLQAKAVTICLVDQEKTSLFPAFSTHNMVEIDLPARTLATLNSNLSIGLEQVPVERVYPSGCEFIKRLSASDSCFAIPLRIGRQTIGEICILQEDTSALAENEKRALQLLANSIAVAIQNAQLTERLHQQALDKGRSDERERLASDLHDNLAQTLNILNNQTNDLIDKLTDENASLVSKEINNIRKNLNIALQQVRLAISGYSVPFNRSENYWKELLQYLDQFKSENDIEILLTDSESIMSKLTGIVQKQIIFILREALTNIKKHSQATLVEIALVEVNSTVEFMIADNGTGFNPSLKKGDHHLGLQIMKARAERTGGMLTIQSEVGKGTVICARFPYNQELSKVNGAL